MAHGLDQATNRIDRALPDYIHKLQVDGRDRTYHAVIAELIKYVVGAARPIPGIQMIYGIIIKLLDQGGSIVYEKEICRATAKRSSSGTGIGEIVDQLNILPPPERPSRPITSEISCAATL